MIKTFEANVTKTIIEIHFFWAGKGTCCIPFQSTYGPLVSAIHVYQGYLYLFLLFITYNCIFPKSIILRCCLFYLFLNSISSLASNAGFSAKRDKKRVGKLFGIAVGSAAGFLIMSSIFYLWWIKDKSGHMQVHTNSPSKGYFH